MSRKRVLQQSALALGFVAYVGYVVVDRFAEHKETAIKNAKQRGRERGERKARLREIEEAVAERERSSRGVGAEGNVGKEPPRL